jgi:uncharacterized iron-regulated membrane protein
MFLDPLFLVESGIIHHVPRKKWITAMRRTRNGGVTSDKVRFWRKRHKLFELF